VRGPEVRELDGDAVVDDPEQTGTGSASLTDGDGTVMAMPGGGKGKQQDLQLETLSSIIEALNAKFGTNLNERDQLLFDQFEETWVADPEVMAQARNNEFENFRLVFDRMFMGTVVGRMDDNEAIFKRVLDDDEFQKTLMDLYAVCVYRRLREGDERLSAGSRTTSAFGPGQATLRPTELVYTRSRRCLLGLTGSRAGHATPAANTS
jgi:hypothetical protein